jgi:hypothetical protein
MAAGYLYVLTHPCHPDLYKIGQTIRHPTARLAEHNSSFTAYTGRIVKESGRNWEMKTFIAVPDTNEAEAAFWAASPYADMPYLSGIEAQTMTWAQVEVGLNAAKKAGMCPRRAAKPLADWVYGYTAWMRKRLEGRDIELLGYTTSRSGKSNFRCGSGHQWRTGSVEVAEGAGCPECGIGARTPAEIWQSAKLSYLCLLTHSDKPGVINVGLTQRRPSDWHEESTWGDWAVHRSRFVEDPVLAQSLIWPLLRVAQPSVEGEAIPVELSLAEQAFREIMPRMHEEYALRAKETEADA